MDSEKKNSSKVWSVFDYTVLLLLYVIKGFISFNYIKYNSNNIIVLWHHCWQWFKEEVRKIGRIVELWRWWAAAIWRHFGLQNVTIKSSNVKISKPEELLKFIVQCESECVFSKLCIAIKIMLTIAVPSGSCERSFIKLTLIL